MAIMCCYLSENDVNNFAVCVITFSWVSTHLSISLFQATRPIS